MANQTSDPSVEFEGSLHPGRSRYLDRSRDRWMAALLIAIGISEPAGAFLHSPLLRGLGRLSSASVNPLVFNQVGGIEFWAARYRFELAHRDGTVTSIPVTHHTLAGIRGPHPRTAAYVVSIGLGPLSGPGVYGPPLHFGLCNRGPLARVLGFDGTLASALIQVESGTPGDDREWTLTIRCDV